MASAAIKRQRKRRRIDSDGDPEFQVAPMVDVLLVLMLFFMAITSTEVLKKDKNLQLADAKDAKKAEGKKNSDVVINVSWDGVNNAAVVSFNGIGYPGGATDPSLVSAVAAAHNQSPNANVVIRADRDVQYSNISDLMASCGSAGIGTVTFAVLIGGDSNDKNKGAGDASTK